MSSSDKMPAISKHASEAEAEPGIKAESKSFKAESNKHKIVNVLVMNATSSEAMKVVVEGAMPVDLGARVSSAASQDGAAIVIHKQVDVSNGTALDQIMKRVANLEATVIDLTQQVNGLTQQVNGLTQQVNGLTQQGNDLTQQVNDLVFSDEQKSEEIQELQQETEILHGDVLDLQFQNQDLRNRVNQLTKLLGKHKKTQLRPWPKQEMLVETPL